jgi:hypothetical protein
MDVDVIGVHLSHKLAKAGIVASDWRLGTGSSQKVVPPYTHGATPLIVKFSGNKTTGFLKPVFCSKSRVQ